MKVLVLGSGAKDHALAWWLSKSKFISGLYMSRGNLATSDYAFRLDDIDPSSKEDVYKAVLAYGIDLVVIGTEAPLTTGVIAYLNEKGISTFGAPTKAIKLEDDKAFARDFSERHNITTPRRSLFGDILKLRKYLERHNGEEFIVKSNNISPSREVLRSNDTESLIRYAQELMKRGPVLLEEYIPGLPITATIFLDDKGYMMLPVLSEYTEKNKGDNTPTGGMGAVCPVPLRQEMMEKIEERIIKPTLYGMQVEELSYKGVLTFSIIISKEGEPVLVDYHVRFNDPAAQAFIPLIKNDFLEIVEAMKENRISSMKLETSNDFSVAVVLASEGYPLKPVTGREVRGLTVLKMNKIKDYAEIFVGAVDMKDGKAVTTGGRNITVVGLSDSLESANKKAYEMIKSIRIDGGWYRNDIGNRFFKENKEEPDDGKT